MSTKQTQGIYPSFDRSGQPTRATHYCAGCGHGILHKLIAEALVELGIQDRTIIVNPIGCAVFGYYYWDVGNIGAAHGRAPAVATALNRLIPQAVVISYQGDGDLGAIGLNCTLQAAIRGERMVTFFVNNATYGMTGGQMAPTSLIGQRTATSPHGRDVSTMGYPLHVCEVLDRLQAPVYIERCSLADTPRILKARHAVRHALELQRDGKGYAFVELLSPCPTNMGLDSLQTARFVSEQMEAEFPLGCLRDHSDAAAARPPAAPAVSLASYFGSIADDEPTAVPGRAHPYCGLKFSGFGGQGILSLGVCVAEAGRLSGAHTSWLPSYGPEQRGGTASCSVVVSGDPIGSPAVDRPHVLLCLNQPAYERFAADVQPGGIVIVDTNDPNHAALSGDVRLIAVPATELARQNGVPRAANTAMLAVLAASGVSGIPEEAMLKSLDAGLRRKPALVEANRRVYAAARAWYVAHAANGTLDRPEQTQAATIPLPTVSPDADDDLLDACTCTVDAAP